MIQFKTYLSLFLAFLQIFESKINTLKKLICRICNMETHRRQVKNSSNSGDKYLLNGKLISDTYGD